MKLLDRNKLAQNIDIAAAYDFEHQKVFGSAYAVMQNDELLLKKYYGHTSAEQEKPVSEQTMFRLASMTKPVTAVAALILADRGTISLEDRVSKYLPEFEHIHVVEEDADGQLTDRGEASNPVLLRHLLTHTSGIGSSAGKLSQLPREVKANLDRSVCFFLEQGLDFEPGTKQQYSGFAAFDVLVKIIEQVTAADYEEFLRKEIFVPCGMDSTVFVPSEEQWERVIDMHNRVDGKCVKAVRKDNCIFEDFPCTHYLGGAGLVSTLEDYLKFAQMLLHQGETPEGPLMKKATFQLMCTPQISEEIMPGSERWGLGVRVITDTSYPDLEVHTFGWSGAYGSHFWVDPVNKVTAVFMKNTLFDGGAGNESAGNFEKAVKLSGR